MLLKELMGALLRCCKLRRKTKRAELTEVSLRRTNSHERLGLTLCYGSGDDVETDIFVSEIETQSIAERDGRIKSGDQILQINGEDVHTRNQAIELFRQNRTNTRLLLARSSNDSLPSTEATCEEESAPGFACLSPMPEQQTAEEDAGALTDATRDSNGSAHEKDSGISRTTDSEPELPPPLRSPSQSGGSSGTCNSPADFVPLAEECNSSTVTATPTEVTWKTTPGSVSRHFAESTSALSSPGSEAPPCPAPNRLTRSDSDGSLERELACLHREMETIRLECDRLIQQHETAEERVWKQMRQAHTLMATMDTMTLQQQLAKKNQTQTQQQETYGRLNHVGSSPPPTREKLSAVPVVVDSPLSTPGGPARRKFVPGKIAEQSPQLARVAGREDTSSAYNTGGESCRSTPLNMDRMGGSDSTADNGKRDLANFTFPFNTARRSVGNCHGVTELKPAAVLLQQQEQRASKVTLRVPAPCLMSTQTQDPFYSQVPATMQQTPSAIMYTTPENLNDTIKLQQRFLRQAMIQQAQQLRDRTPLIQGPVSSSSLYQAVQNNQEEMEWKLKRRSDGSRYVTRRPVRNKLLKDRAQKLTNERFATSTDDDAISELKIGRYWSKDERKKHLERSKERKRRQEEVVKRKMASLNQAGDQEIMQLSHKKMMRRKGQQLFDKFTTIQEVLSHGNRSIGNSKAMGILSVTTV